MLPPNEQWACLADMPDGIHEQIGVTGISQADDNK